MSSQRLAGLVIGFGSICFLVAAFLPISRVYATNEAEAKLEIITGSLSAWRISQVLFAVGAVVTAIGLGWLMLMVDVPLAKPYLALPGALLGIGAVLWSLTTYLRAVDPEGWVSGALPGWHFTVFTLLTIAGLGITGLIFQRTGPTWLGLTLIIASTIFLIGFLVFRDLPPFLLYLLTLVVAVESIRSG